MLCGLTGHWFFRENFKWGIRDGLMICEHLYFGQRWISSPRNPLPWLLCPLPWITMFVRTVWLRTRLWVVSPHMHTRMVSETCSVHVWLLCRRFVFRQPCCYRLTISCHWLKEFVRAIRLKTIELCECLIISEFLSLFLISLLSWTILSCFIVGWLWLASGFCQGSQYSLLTVQ